jgi:hypothetical protein
MNCQRCVNLFPEIDRSSRHVVGLYGTPGKTLRTTIGTGPIRGLYAGESYLYAVSGTTLYYIDTNWIATSMGTLTSSTGTVSFAENTTQLILADGGSLYTATLPNSTLAVVSDADVPSSPSRVDVLDGYAITDNVGTGKFYISSINDATAWDALDFANAEGAPDDIVSVLADHREVWLFGVKTTEVWYNSGNSDFPFERIQGAFIEQGCAAKHSVAKADNSVFWLGSSDRGDSIVYKATGYQPKRISTHAIEYAISNYSTISDAIGWTYEEEGHTFYVLTFPTGNATWVYDVSTEMWHERSYMNQSDGSLGRDRANAHAFFNRNHVVGDYVSGKIYTLDLDVYTDNSEYIKRLRSASSGMDNRVYEISMTDPVKAVFTGGDLEVTKGKDRNFHLRLQITMESGVGLVTGQGSDPQVMMRYSDRNGHGWSDELWASAGGVGEYGRRVIYRRLGTVATV